MNQLWNALCVKCAAHMLTKTRIFVPLSPLPGPVCFEILIQENTHTSLNNPACWSAMMRTLRSVHSTLSCAGSQLAVLQQRIRCKRLHSSTTVNRPDTSTQPRQWAHRRDVRSDSRVVAIGDVHGDSGAFERLLVAGTQFRLCRF